jgi:hypothetical protein
LEILRLAAEVLPRLPIAKPIQVPKLENIFACFNHEHLRI